MARVAYLDCPAGIAGDMCLGALLDLGVPLDYLRQELAKLGLQDEVTLEQETVWRQGQRALKAHVQLHHGPEPRDHHHHHSEAHGRHWPDIVSMIQGAALPEQAHIWSLKIFEALAIAEGKVHGIAPEAVHFHEVGAVDALVDIVGTCLGLTWLGVEQVYCSALPTGGGTVKAAHGILPVPVPAVLQLWQTRQIPIYDNGIAKEMVTPTGAAIAVALAEHFGAPPAMHLKQIGLGAGSQDFTIPNILRIWLGEVSEPHKKKHGLNTTDLETCQETIIELQTQLDDLSPQAIAYASERLYQAGAVEVFNQPITMKKSRLGSLLTVLCPLDAEADCLGVLFAETTTLGIRRHAQDRYILDRHFKTVNTPLGAVQVKLAYYQGMLINLQPEYEDCATLARQHQRTWQEVQQLAISAAHEQLFPDKG